MNMIKALMTWIFNNKKNEVEKLLDQFDKDCAEICNEANRVLPTGIIYHYTDFVGLKGIFETKRLRYTDYRHLNDPTELKYSMKLIREAILNSDIIKYRYLTWAVFQIFDKLDKIYYVYISSFSEKEKLSLWRYYASNGTGFAIGFNQDFIKINPEGQMNSSMICNVMYGEKESKDEIMKFIRVCLETLEEAGERATNNDFSKKLAVRFISQLITILPVFKDESFKEEEEIRLVHTEGSLKIDPDTDKPYFVEDKHRKFVKIKSRYVPFVNFKQGKKPTILPDEISSADISEIIIGPACGFLEARTALRNLLLDNNFDLDKIEIKQSNFSFSP